MTSGQTGEFLICLFRDNTNLFPTKFYQRLSYHSSPKKKLVNKNTAEIIEKITIDRNFRIAIACSPSNRTVVTYEYTYFTCIRLRCEPRTTIELHTLWLAFICICHQCKFSYLKKSLIDNQLIFIYITLYN